jgi:BirA family biotin operon repressor/biotin-[acetyl-CoA-carboxylase] ligase
MLRPGGRLRRVTVVAEAGSTQDLARGAASGDVIVARRQTGGRGRWGRAWADTGDEGVAVTFVVDREPGPRLAEAAAVAVAEAVEACLGRPVGLKRPNDVLVDGRKLAGVLVEQFDDLAAIGIGVNVLQGTWPAELAGRAVSLAELGADIGRLDVLAALLPAMETALGRPAPDLAEAFAARVLPASTIG